MHEFLSTWYGLTIFILIDIVALVAIIAIGYRFCFKRLFDILLSCLCFLFTWPIFLWVFTRYKKYQKAGGEVDGFLRSAPAVGKKGKTVAITCFQTLDKEGNLAGEYGKGLSERAYLYLPRLIDIFLGRASFIGVSALKFQDAAFLDDEQEERYAAPIGILSPVSKDKRGGDSAEILAEESAYAKNFSLFIDCKLFFSFLLSKIRGEKEEKPNVDYAKSLVEKEIITQAEYDSVLESAEQEAKEWQDARSKKDK